MVHNNDWFFLFSWRHQLFLIREQLILNWGRDRKDTSLHVKHTKTAAAAVKPKRKSKSPAKSKSERLCACSCVVHCV